MEFIVSNIQFKAISSISFIGYCPAELQLVFCAHHSLHHPARTEKLYALVLWYSKIPSRPDKYMKMYEVHQESDMHGHQRSGVIELSQVKALCPLAPKIIDECPSDLTMDNCFEHIIEYYIHPYSSHSHYHHL